MLIILIYISYQNVKHIVKP